MTPHLGVKSIDRKMKKEWLLCMSITKHTKNVGTNLTQPYENNHFLVYFGFHRQFLYLKMNNFETKTYSVFN